MQTKKVAEDSYNVPENAPLTPVEDDMSDIPGIRVSMATIVESYYPLEEQQRLFDEDAPTVSEKITDEFSGIITSLEGRQQINLSEMPNQQELQSTQLTKKNITNEASDVPFVTDVTNKTKKDETILTSETSVITVTTENIKRLIENMTENINKSNEIQNSSNSQRVQNIQSIQQHMIINQDISQQQSKQKPEQFINDKVSPIVNEMVPSIEVSPQQLQQLSIPLVNNASDATSDDVQQMSTLNSSSDDYKNASPHSTLTTSTVTIKKAHAIAAKLFNNNEDVQQGVKRPYEGSYISQDSRDENHRDRGRYNDYGRDSKRAAYDNGISRPEYDSVGVVNDGVSGVGGGNRHRYGLGNGLGSE